MIHPCRPSEKIWAVHLRVTFMSQHLSFLFLSFLSFLTSSVWQSNDLVGFRSKHILHSTRKSFFSSLSLSLLSIVGRSDTWTRSVDWFLYRQPVELFSPLRRARGGGNDWKCVYCIDMKCDDDINTTPFSETTQQRKAKRKESEGEVRYFNI